MNFLLKFKRLLLIMILFVGATTEICAALYEWKPIYIGAGGYITGIDIAPDGTKGMRLAPPSALSFPAR